MELISLGDSTKHALSDEIETFSIHDHGLRETILNAGKLFCTDDKMKCASTYLNNKITSEIRNCNKHGVCFPVNYLVLSDLLTYLECYYYESLDIPMTDLEAIIVDINRRSVISKLLHRKELTKELYLTRKVLMEDYDRIAEYIYDFDISKNGDLVLNAALLEVEEEHRYKIIDYHRRYHEKMNNTLMLEKIK